MSPKRPSAVAVTWTGLILAVATFTAWLILAVSVLHSNDITPEDRSTNAWKEFVAVFLFLGSMKLFETSYRHWKRSKS